MMNQFLNHSTWLTLLAGVGLAMSGLVVRGDDVAPDAPASAFPPASAALVENVKGLLDEGFQTGPKRLQTAQKKLASARNLDRKDPRIDYAFGLVLLKHAQHRQAIVEFETATGRSGEPYWPAWQALIRTHLIEKQYDKGLARLDEYAALVHKAGDMSEPTDQQREAARWMGQILEALEKSVAAVKIRELIDASEGRVREALGDDLIEDFELGCETTNARHFAILQESGIAADNAEKKQSRRRASQANKLANNLKDLDKVKEDTAKSTEEWKAWLDENLSAADKQIGQLEKDYQRLQERAQSLERSIILVGREITALDLQMNAPRSDGNTVINPQFQYRAQQQLSQRQNQMFGYQSEYNASIARMMQTAQEGQSAMRLRAGIVQKYEKATGDLVKKNRELEKWSTRVADKKKKMEAQPAAKGKGGKPPADLRALALKSLMPFDLDLEKTRLLETYGVAPPAIAADKQP